MTTLGQRYKAAEQKRNEAYDGKPPFPKDIFKTHNQPEEINALTTLRESLERVVAKAKLDFIRGIEANIHGPEFLPVATYVPGWEGCYDFLYHGVQNETGLIFPGAVSNTKKFSTTSGIHSSNGPARKACICTAAGTAKPSVFDTSWC